MDFEDVFILKYIKQQKYLIPLSLADRFPICTSTDLIKIGGETRTKSARKNKG